MPSVVSFERVKRSSRQIDIGIRGEIRRLSLKEGHPRIIWNDSQVTTFRNIVELLPFCKDIVVENMMEEEYWIKASCLVIARIAIGAENGSSRSPSGKTPRLRDGSYYADFPMK